MTIDKVRTHRRIFWAFAYSCSVLVFSFAGNSASGADGPSAGASRFDDLVRQGEIADGQFDPEKALQFYLKASSDRPKDPQVLLKIAKAYHDSTIAISDPNETSIRLEKALRYAKRAEELDPRSPVALLLQAICYGKLGELSGIRKKIEYARLVKDYADRALALDPDYAYAHDVLGQWEFEVAALGRTRQFLVTLIYGGLPPASTEESVRHLERAVQLEPNSATHRLALGFAYLANGESTKARRSFEQVMAMPCREIYDSDCQQQAERAIANL